MFDNKESRTNLSELGEFGLIDHLTRYFEIKRTSTNIGIGDDAAVLNFEGEETVVTTDLLVEGVHFDLSFMPLKHLGYKAVMVNLSDVYAMNAGHIFHRFMEKIGLIISPIHLIYPVFIPGGIGMRYYSLWLMK